VLYEYVGSVLLRLVTALRTLCTFYLALYLYKVLLYKNIKNKIYAIITLPVVLYGCETRSATLREERRLMMLESRVLRERHGHTLHSLYSLLRVGEVVRMEEKRNAYGALVGRGEDVGVDGRIIIKHVLDKYYRRA
jgi:hypothetical protein